MSGLTADGIGVIITLAAAFAAHVFYFGRMLGRFETDLRALAEGFKNFQSQHFLPRSEYEARHTELIELIKSLYPKP